MQFKLYQNRLSQLSARFNLMVALVFGLLLANVLLSSLAWYGFRHHTVEITPFFGESRYVKSEQRIDSDYLRLMSENFIYSRLNVTPETVNINHERLLKFVDSQHYADILKRLTAEAKIIQQQKIASEFVITAPMEVNLSALEVKISGLLKRSVGLRTLKIEQLTYRLTFCYHQGRLSILTFTKEKPHA